MATAKWLMAQEKPLRGAPPPTGLGFDTPVVHKKEWKVKFDMLDENGLGALDRRQARNYLRACGYCVANEVLDEMLWDSPVGREIQRKIDHGFFSKAELEKRDNPKLGMWKCDDLVKLIQDPRNQQRENGNLDATKEALRRLSFGRGKIGRDRLLRVLSEYHGITEEDLNQTLELCGIGSFRELLPCDGLAFSLLKRVAAPLGVREFDMMCDGATVVKWDVPGQREIDDDQISQGY
eukprot:TRINITY_DN38535_c0_g1_i1.p1 TRINITY_DN38535_c0_g1~~TRINITY_DN38535_c0_g1_i1.p1  ORF type:complete len:236 (+),score=56.02 TRINITY_DN38535_c0_g1_i1:59-766(+)